MSMSTLPSTKLYMKQKLSELKIYKLSDLVQQINALGLVSADVKIDEDKDNAMILLCFLSPLLTALKCKKETIGLDRWLKVLSWEPRLFVYQNFLTNEECEHLINLAKPTMAKSRVVDRETGGPKESSVRTSTGTFLRRGHDKIVEEIENRISEFTFIPVEYGRGLQVIHYEVGQKCNPHCDYISDELMKLIPRGQIIATVLMYLSDVDEGGKTVFPLAKGIISKRGFSVLPKKRDAVLFWNMRPDVSPDPLSRHGGSPVIKGNKWASTKWFFVRDYQD